MQKRENNQAKDARSAALTVLLRCERNGAWLDGALKNVLKESALEPRDAALCSKLCYGVCQNRLLLEFWLSKFSKVKPEKLEPAVRIALLLAMYQITMLDKIPPRAAVNESVNLARRNSKNPRSPTLVNGILRSFCRAQENLPQPDDLATRYSHPQWLVDLLSQEIPAAELESLLASNNAEPPTTIQTNTTKITPDALAETLAAQGVTVETHPWLDGCFTLRGTGDLEQLKAFRDGLFLVQDTASRLVVLAAQPEAGQHILDACGAPGGKSFSTAIAIGDDGSILSCDIHPSKVKQIQKGAKRLGLASIQSQIRNAKEYDPSLDEQFDLAPAWASSVRSRTSGTRIRNRSKTCRASRVTFWKTSAGTSSPAVCWSTPPARCWSGKIRTWCGAFWPSIRSLRWNPSPCPMPSGRWRRGC